MIRTPELWDCAMASAAKLRVGDGLHLAEEDRCAQFGVLELGEVVVLNEALGRYDPQAAAGARDCLADALGARRLG